MAMRPKRWGFVAGTLVLAATLMGLRQLDAPLVLYPASDSLPRGLYLQTFGTPEIGKIAAFPIPEAARRYQSLRGNSAPNGFLFMKLITTGPGDQVCNGSTDLFLNGKRQAATASHDSEGNPLPVWKNCRSLHQDEFFMLSDYTVNSFDSRYFGPVRIANIVGVYRPAF